MEFQDFPKEVEMMKLYLQNEEGGHLNARKPLEVGKMFSITSSCHSIPDKELRN